MTLEQVDAHLKAGRVVKLGGHRREATWRKDWLVERFEYGTLGGVQVFYNVYRGHPASAAVVVGWLERGNATVHEAVGASPMPGVNAEHLCTAHPGDPDAA